MNDSYELKSKKDAKQDGSKYYFTGIACVKGHIARRRTSNSACLECELLNAKDKYHKHKHKNREKTNELSRARYWRDIERSREIGRARVSARRKISPEKEKAARQRRHEANPTEARERMRQWRLKNLERSRAASRKSARKKRETPCGRLNSSMSAGIRMSIRAGAKGGRKWEYLVGYSVQQLKDHLEALFVPGMTWENYGKWEIDHKVPLSAHNFDTAEDIDFKRAWALSNLQPLWMSDNRSKGSKLSAPFQPSLALAEPANDNQKVKETAA